MVLLSVVECIWGAVCGCQLNETRLLQLNGVFHLLDLLDVIGPQTQKHVLGCLLDLLENPKTRTTFLNGDHP
ncbi:hypothetical protein BC829DRAFT_199929 [Chytridium lagenaria]|nr:hypothetical protein BC829DRAFT_199929 [Chytridium lagenaria]